jgi:hypothetical protein
MQLLLQHPDGGRLAAPAPPGEVFALAGTRYVCNLSRHAVATLQPLRQVKGPQAGQLPRRPLAPSSPARFTRPAPALACRLAPDRPRPDAGGGGRVLRGVAHRHADGAAQVQAAGAQAPPPLAPGGQLAPGSLRVRVSSSSSYQRRAPAPTHELPAPAPQAQGEYQTAVQRFKAAGIDPSTVSVQLPLPAGLSAAQRPPACAEQLQSSVPAQRSPHAQASRIGAALARTPPSPHPCSKRYTAARWTWRGTCCSTRLACPASSKA